MAEYTKEQIVDMWRQGLSIENLTSLIYYGREKGSKLKKMEAQKVVEEAILDWHIKNVAHG
jgi:hypothetical protein